MLAFIDKEACGRFLLEKTQHIIGGFSKDPGGVPDVYHAYMALASLSNLKEESLKRIDPALCVSFDTVTKIEAGRMTLLKEERLQKLGDFNGGGSTEALRNKVFALGKTMLARRSD